MNVRPIEGILALAGLAATGSATAQEIINLPGEDRPLSPDFEEVYRVGSLMGADWEQFGNVHTVAFDGAGRLHVFDELAARISGHGSQAEAPPYRESAVRKRSPGDS